MEVSRLDLEVKEACRKEVRRWHLEDLEARRIEVRRPYARRMVVRRWHLDDLEARRGAPFARAPYGGAPWALGCTRAVWMGTSSSLRL